MVKIASLAVAIMTAVSAASAAATATPPFKQACTPGDDVCGWTLTDGVHAYDPAVLRAAAEKARQNVDPNGNQSIIYDAVYSCGANGAIVWDRYCGVGDCNPATAQDPNSTCRT